VLLSRTQSYDALGRPATCTQQRKTEPARNDSFSYNGRNELTAASLGTAPYGYSYDNIGNRKAAQEIAEELTYAANNLNQYTSITNSTLNSPPSTLEQPFVPQYDTSGNQTLIKTSTGIWTVVYNAANRAVSFTSRDGSTVVECGYDYQGRRYMKKVTENGTVASHERYLYRGYLQIAALDMLNSRNVLRTLLWDPLEPIATRPLAQVQDNALYCYNVDFNKNVTEVFDGEGAIAAAYDYSPYGVVTKAGDLIQPVQWSSEMNDAELALVYYNYRYYHPADGRWINRDPIAEEGGWNLYGFVGNNSVGSIDRNGLFVDRLVSAAISAVVDIGFQVTTNIIEGKPADDIDWVSVGAAAISGAIVPGVSVIKSCQKLGQTLAKNQKAVNKIVELQNKINVLGKYGKLESVTKLEYEQAVVIQTNNYMWAYYVKEEFTMYTFKITNKALAKGIIQSWGTQVDLDNMKDCTVQVIVGQRTSAEGTAERLSNSNTSSSLTI
jgi:RHS repeat-associated core domain